MARHAQGLIAAQFAASPAVVHGYDMVGIP